MFKGDTSGKNADYIPYLAQVNSKLFGIAVVTTDNQVYTVGDISYSFSIQSISKVFTLALAMEQLGADTVFDRIGNEPTGRPFNSVDAVVGHAHSHRKCARKCGCNRDNRTDRGLQRGRKMAKHTGLLQQGCRRETETDRRGVPLGGGDESGKSSACGVVGEIRSHAF